MKQWLVLGVAWFATLTVAVAQGSVDVARDEEDAAALQQYLEQMFTLPAGLAVDASLRGAAAAMAAEHLARMRPVLRDWVAQERAHGGTEMQSGTRYLHLRARLMNELALWRLGGASDAHDEAWMAALLHPTACLALEQSGYFAQHVLLLLPLPPAQRAAALAGERELLRQWGQARATLPARPVPSVAELTHLAIEQIRAGGARPELVMPPVLAWYTLGEPESTPSAAVDCARYQWWLRVSLRRHPEQREQALRAWRYATIQQAAQWLRAPPAATAKTPAAHDYPALARFLDVQGNVTVQVTLDAQGRFQRAAVVGRDIEVAGIRGVRPVAFETLLDEASLASAAKREYERPDPTGLKDGRFTTRIAFNWRLK